MKHLNKYAFLILVALTVSSCDLFNVDVDATLSGVVDVYVDEDMAKGTALDWYDCSGEKVVDAHENEDVQEYYEKIDEITVNDIVAEVLYVSTGDVVLKENAVFYLTYEGETVSWIKKEEWPLKQGSTFNFDNLDSSYDKASKLILKAASNPNASEFTVGVDAESSKSGVNFQIEIAFGSVFTASIL